MGLSTDEVVGRLEFDEGEPDGPFKVVVDGRCMSWAEFGMVLRAYEGWQFRLALDDGFVTAAPESS